MSTLTLREFYALHPKRVDARECSLCGGFHVLVRCYCEFPDGGERWLDEPEQGGAFALSCKHCGLTVTVSRQDETWWRQTIVGWE